MRIRAAAIAALAAAAVLPAQASAHQTFAFHGIGPGADVATVNDTLDSGGHREHAVIQVTDKECDGHPVFARYRWSNGLLKVVEDSDGCRPGVGQAFEGGSHPVVAEARLAGSTPRRRPSSCPKGRAPS